MHEVCRRLADTCARVGVDSPVNAHCDRSTIISFRCIDQHGGQAAVDHFRVLNPGGLVNLAAWLGIGAPQLFDPFAAMMLLGLEAILSGRAADLPNGVQRYPRALEARVVSLARVMGPPLRQCDGTTLGVSASAS